MKKRKPLLFIFVIFLASSSVIAGEKDCAYKIVSLAKTGDVSKTTDVIARLEATDTAQIVWDNIPVSIWYPEFDNSEPNHEENSHRRVRFEFEGLPPVDGIVKISRISPQKIGRINAVVVSFQVLGRMSPGGDDNIDGPESVLGKMGIKSIVIEGEGSVLFDTSAVLKPLAGKLRLIKKIIPALWTDVSMENLGAEVTTAWSVIP